MREDLHIRALAEAITRYLRAHPNAADTVDGVRKWWLSDVGRANSTEQLLQALDQLVEQGVLVRQEVAGGGPLFSAGPRITRRE